jgi:hypothetical protein
MVGIRKFENHSNFAYRLEKVSASEKVPLFNFCGFSDHFLTSARSIHLKNSGKESKILGLLLLLESIPYRKSSNIRQN